MSRIEERGRWSVYSLAVLASGLWLLLLAAPASARDAQVSVFRGEDDLLVDVHTEGLIDDDVQRALRSGLPARVRLRVVLWARRAVLWDEPVTDVQIDLRVVHVLLDDRYDVLDDTGRLVFTSTEVVEVASWVEDTRALPLCALDELDPDRSHYVTTEMRLDPLTIEELRDLRRWLRGALAEEDDRSSVERLSGQLLGVVKGKLGLGDRRRTGRSANFELDTLLAPTRDDAGQR